MSEQPEDNIQLADTGRLQNLTDLVEDFRIDENYETIARFENGDFLDEIRTSEFQQPSWRGMFRDWPN